MKPNKEQNDIIKYFTNEIVDKRIISVEAPPGTGKTYTAVSTCIKYIDFQLKQNSSYNKKTLILTFSKNARAQIEKQLDELSLDEDKLKRYIEITNFHSFFQKYVWAYSKYMGLEEELIITSPKQRGNLLIERLKFIKEYTGDKYQYSWVDSLLEGEFYPLTNEGKIRPAVRKIMSFKDDIINAIKAINKEGYIGFSDIGYYMNELLSKSPFLLKIIQYKYDLIILDEYQDVSDLQDEIVKKIIGEENKAIFFSDSKQMIYGWRGASPDRLKDLFRVYDDELQKMELVTSMRFKDKEDLKEVIEEIRNETYDINQFEASKNIKYIQMKVEDKNFHNQRSKNSMYASLRYKIKNNLPTLKNGENKSIGILCRNNEQVEFLNRKLREEFNIYTKFISNNEEEHNIICDLIEFLDKPVESIDIDELSKEVTRYVFAVIYNVNIGSIKRNKLDTISFSNYKNVKIPVLKAIRLFIEEAYENKTYMNCIYKSITSIYNSELSINYDNMSLLRKILYDDKIQKNNITDLFLQHQYLKSFKELKGIYILNIHQSKGREFDFVYLIDRESINKDENLLYVGVSRTKEKLVVLDWVEQ